MKNLFNYILCLCSLFVFSCSSGDDASYSADDDQNQNDNIDDPLNPFPGNIRWEQLASCPISFSFNGIGDIAYDDKKIYYLVEKNKLCIYDIIQNSWNVESLPDEMHSITIWENVLWGFNYPSAIVATTVKAYSYTNGQWNSHEITKPAAYSFFSVSDKLYNMYVSGQDSILQEYDRDTDQWNNKTLDIYVPTSLFPIIGDEWYYVNNDPDYNYKEISLYSYNPTKNLQLKRYTIQVKGAGAYVAKYKNRILVWNSYNPGSSGIATTYSISSYDTETNQCTTTSVDGSECFPPFSSIGSQYFICIGNRVFAGPVNSNFYEMKLLK